MFHSDRYLGHGQLVLQMLGLYNFSMTKTPKLFHISIKVSVLKGAAVSDHLEA